MTAQAIHLPQYEKPALCAECGGRCCQNYPGLLHPSEVGAPKRVAMLHRLVELLVTGLWAVDCWEEDDEIDRDTYFVRPAMHRDGLAARCNHRSSAARRNNRSFAARRNCRVI